MRAEYKPVISCLRIPFEVFFQISIFETSLFTPQMCGFDQILLLYVLNVRLRKKLIFVKCQSLPCFIHFSYNLLMSKFSRSFKIPTEKAFVNWLFFCKPRPKPNFPTIRPWERRRLQGFPSFWTKKMFNFYTILTLYMTESKEYIRTI